MPEPSAARLPLTFPVPELEADLARLQLGGFIHYQVIPLTAPAHLVDPSIPAPAPVEDYADGSWTEWLPTTALAQSPALASVVDAFAAKTRVTLVRLLRLEAGGVIPVHSDPTLGLHVERSVVRLTVPITTHPDVTFFLNDQPVPMRPGECWYLRLSDPHRVVNNSPIERVHLTIDVAPNDWVRAQIGA